MPPITTMYNPFKIDDDCSVQRELALAIRSDNFFEVKYLIEQCGANPRGYEYLANTVSLDAPGIHNGITIAEYAGRTCKDPHILSLLFRYGMDPTKTMIGCIKNRNLFGVMQCILHGANVNHRYKGGRTLVQTLVQEQIDRPDGGDMAIYNIICLLFHCGYKDKNKVVGEMLRNAQDPELRQILRVADGDREDLGGLLRAFIQNRNILYPYKNPANYFPSGVPGAYKEPEY